MLPEWLDALSNTIDNDREKDKFNNPGALNDSKSTSDNAVVHILWNPAMVVQSTTTMIKMPPKMKILDAKASGKTP